MIKVNCANKMYIATLIYNFLPTLDRPKVFLSGSLQSGLSVRRGEEIHLTAYISGFPYPEITWMRNNSTIRPEALKKRPEKPKKKKVEKKAEKTEEEKDKPEEKKEEEKEKKEEIPEEAKEQKAEPEEAEEPEEEYHPSLNERLTIDNARKGESYVVLKDVIRGDHGLFTIKVENDHGVATASCEIAVLGKFNIILNLF